MNDAPLVYIIFFAACGNVLLLIIAFIVRDILDELRKAKDAKEKDTEDE